MANDILNSQDIQDFCLGDIFYFKLNGQKIYAAIAVTFVF